MKKKALHTMEIIFWIPRIIFLIIVMFALMFLLRHFIFTTVDISEVRATTFIHRSLYSPNGLSYLDEATGRIYTGIIDLEKFKDSTTLENSIFYGEKNTEVAAKFELVDEETNKLHILYYNQDKYEDWKKFHKLGYTKGPGGFRSYTKKFNVLIATPTQKRNRASLMIEVIIPNS